MLLKEAEVYLQFLNEDMDRIESLGESIASQIEKLIKGATRKLQESLNLLNMEIKEEKDKKLKQKATILLKSKILKYRGTFILY